MYLDYHRKEDTMQCRVNVLLYSSVQGFFFLSWVWPDYALVSSDAGALGESNERSMGDSDGVTVRKGKNSLEKAVTQL